jgi:hypothetical protein
LFFKIVTRNIELEQRIQFAQVQIWFAVISLIPCWSFWRTLLKRESNKNGLHLPVPSTGGNEFIQVPEQRREHRLPFCDLTMLFSPPCLSNKDKLNWTFVSPGSAHMAPKALREQPALLYKHRGI